MTQINPQHIILKPVITEKSLSTQPSGEYTFWVSLAATKSQIAAAFKLVFNIDPILVRTARVKGKVKTDWKKRLPFNKSDRKKAIVKVAKDKQIDSLKLNQK